MIDKKPIRTPSTMFEELKWEEGRFLLDEMVFRIEQEDRENWDRVDYFRFYKRRNLIDQYEEFWKRYPDFQASHVFELGILDGGSPIFWSTLFRPDRHVGVDFMPCQSTEYFERQMELRNLEDRLSLFWETNQSDGRRLRKIAEAELDSEIDLIFDDASHLYEPTKSSFETLYPLLRPGGLFIIEDWAWNHWPDFHDPDHPWRSERPLTDLVIELIEAAGTAPAVIANVTVFPGFIAIERGPGLPDKKLAFQLADHIRRRPGQPDTSGGGSQIATRINTLPYSELSDDRWLELNLDPDQSPPNGCDFRIPSLPPDAVQERFTGQFGRPNLQQAFEFYRLVRDRFLSGQGFQVMDFGAGWGRIARFFLKEVDRHNLVTVDAQVDAVEWQKELGLPCRIILTDPLPPIPGIPAEEFNVIYSYSVFSHLTESHFKRWIQYLIDILAEDGTLVFTTFGQRYLSRIERDRDRPEVFGDYAKIREQLDGDDFLWFRSRGDDADLSGSFYGEAFVTRKFVEKAFPNCELIYFEDLPEFAQTVIALKRRT